MGGDERHPVAVAAIVLDGQRRVLLMRRRDHGNWEPPGGVLKLKEEIVEGTRREVWEETRTAVEPKALAGVYKNVHTGVLTVVSLCDATSDSATATGEAADVRWMATDQIDELLGAEYAVWVRDALTGSPTVRAQKRTIKGASESPDRS